MTRVSETPDLHRAVFVEGQDLCRGTPSFPEGAEAGRLVSLRVLPNSVEIDYDARTAGMLTLTDTYARGWRATIDHRPSPVLRVDGVFRGVCIDDPGMHHVELVYRPPNWWLALTLCGSGAVGLAMVFLTRRQNGARWATHQ